MIKMQNFSDNIGQAIPANYLKQFPFNLCMHIDMHAENPAQTISLAYAGYETESLRQLHRAINPQAH